MGHLFFNKGFSSRGVQRDFSGYVLKPIGLDRPGKICQNHCKNWNGTIMELRHLRYFVAVAEALSFTKAAERLHLAQPSLTRQIKDLEAEIEVWLIDRSGKRISLT